MVDLLGATTKESMKILPLLKTISSIFLACMTLPLESSRDQIPPIQQHGPSMETQVRLSTYTQYQSIEERGLVLQLVDIFSHNSYNKESFQWWTDQQTVNCQIRTLRGTCCVMLWIVLGGTVQLVNVVGCTNTVAYSGVPKPTACICFSFTIVLQSIVNVLFITTI